MPARVKNQDDIASCCHYTTKHIHSQENTTIQIIWRPKVLLNDYKITFIPRLKPWAFCEIYCNLAFNKGNSPFPAEHIYLLIYYISFWKFSRNIIRALAKTIEEGLFDANSIHAYSTELVRVPMPWKVH